MIKLKAWWLTVGWPWLKTNWWMVLLLPVLAVVATAWFMSKYIRPEVVISDPTSAADERARTEADLVLRQLGAEKTRLAGELADIKKKYADLQVKFEERLAAEIDDLRQNPDKLREAMLAAGKL